MKLTVVVDNHTYIDQYYLGEPALCLYIEEDGNRILFDTGYSDIFLSNAEKMNIDLNKLTHIVLSHGHNDHTRGLGYLIKKAELSQTTLITHPDCLLPKREGEMAIGSELTKEELACIGSSLFSVRPVKLSEHMTFLGQIPRMVSFEARRAIGEVKKEGGWETDYIMEDSALVCNTPKGLFIITGCSHSGICNIIEYAKSVCHDDRIYGVIGGFHLFEEDIRLEHTIDYLRKAHIEKLYPCHCVSFAAKARMNEFMKVQEVGVGLTLLVL